MSCLPLIVPDHRSNCKSCWVQSIGELWRRSKWWWGELWANEFWSFERQKKKKCITAKLWCTFKICSITHSSLVVHVPTNRHVLTHETIHRLNLFSPLKIIAELTAIQGICPCYTLAVVNHNKSWLPSAYEALGLTVLCTNTHTVDVAFMAVSACSNTHMVHSKQSCHDAPACVYVLKHTRFRWDVDHLHLVT